jgi:hypothetical protein
MKQREELGMILEILRFFHGNRLLKSVDGSLRGMVSESFIPA